jgi:hypothetical protein
MNRQPPGTFPEPFLPGGLPLRGRFARFQGVLFACRIGAFQWNGRLDDDVTLIARDTDNPGPEWSNAPHPFNPAFSEWTRVVKQDDTDETFSCIAIALWRGLELGGLDYTPSTRLIGGYLNPGFDSTHPAAEFLHNLVQVDRSTWHGRIPFDEMERLEISRTPIPPIPPQSEPAAPWWMPARRRRNAGAADAQSSQSGGPARPIR